MTRFILIRHATNDTVGKLLAGRMKGVHLNEEGKAQAQRLADDVKGLQIDALYSSPMERAIETAEPLAKALHLQVQIREEFLELDLGDWTSITLADVKAKPAFKHFNSFRSGTRIPGGETMLEAQVRFLKGLENLCRQHPQQTVAVVSHGDPIKAAVAYYAGIPLDLFHRMEISPASVSIVEVFEETARVLLVNYTGGINF